MGYIVESYREDSEKIMRKLHEAKMAICEAMEALGEDMGEYEERRNYRGNYRMNRRHSDRYDY